MTRAEFVAILEEGLEVDAGTLSGPKCQRLADLDCWDSMATLIFMSLAHRHIQVKVTGDQMASCKTLDALLALLEPHLSD